MEENKNNEFQGFIETHEETKDINVCYEEITEIKPRIYMRWIKRRTGYEGSRVTTVLQVCEGNKDGGKWVDVPTINEEDET